MSSPPTCSPMAAFPAPYDPPFLQHYSSLLAASAVTERHEGRGVMEECELPLIDFKDLRFGGEEVRMGCVAEIANASSEWGFFQLSNHGVSEELLKETSREQRRAFHMSFERKNGSKALNESYRWGNPTATSLDQFSWSESFHVPLSKLSEGGASEEDEFRSLRELMQKVAGAMSELARILAGVLAYNLGSSDDFFAQNCSENTCFLRLNRYPSCPFSPKTFGLMPHTDSDFLTILHQDHVGGLQLMKDSKWVTIKPNPQALLVNIGDLFQAWSNDVYKSVEHKVMTNSEVERYSIAYFLCPSYDSIVSSCKEPSRYRKFTFREFRRQVQEDVKTTGYKVGLSRFLL